MRIALIHTWDSSADVGDRVWGALCRTFPQAERFTSDIWQSIEDSHWHQAAPRRLQLMEQGLPRHNQLLSRLPRDPQRDAVCVKGYELVISTSLSAANLVTTEPETLHACFMGTEMISHPAQTTCDPAAATVADLSQSLRQLANASNHAARLPRVVRGEDICLPARESRVTHYLATTHAVAAQYHFDLDGRPHTVLYPPIDTTFFRPGAETHENYYLLVCHPGISTDVALVIQACAAAHRELVVLGAETLRAEIGTLPAGVRWEALPSDMELRSRMRRCRALLSISPSGFDPALIEAQACGTPVIAYHNSSTEEMMLDAERTGLGTGLFFHTLTASSLVSAIHELERRPQNVSAVLSLAQAEMFSPAHFERGVLNNLLRWVSDREASRGRPAPILQLQKSADPSLTMRRRAA